MARADVDAVFEAHDMLTTPGAAAPFGSTGSAPFNQMATLRGLPTVALSFARDARGLPSDLKATTTR